MKIILIILLIIIFFCFNYYRKFSYRIDYGLGNQISQFLFINMIRQVYKFSKFIYPKDFKITYKDFKDIKFPILSKKEIGIFKTFFPRYLFINVHATWHPHSFFNNSKFILYWNTMKPIIKKIFSDKLKKPSQLYPVIYFRCSDSPFRRFYWLTLKKQSFYDKISEELLSLGYKEVILLSCPNHTRKIKNLTSCIDYTDNVKNILEKNGLKVIVECKSIIEDLSTIFYSPKVYSVTSSFSFFPGFSGNSIFKMTYSNDYNYFLDYNLIPWHINSSYLSHYNVKNYHNTDKVILKLKNI